MKSPTHNIARVLSKLGLCSRKQAIELIKAGKVRLDGKTVFDPGVLAFLNSDILVNEKKPRKEEKLYVLLNKPVDCVTTRSDERGRETVYKFLAGVDKWLFPVGRLDKDSEGLLLFTNDSDFGEMMTDPGFKIPRTYEVLVSGSMSDGELACIRRGTDIGRGESSKPASVKIKKTVPWGVSLEITLTEGKNREIRRLFAAYGRTVLKLQRTRFGPFKLGNLKPGEWRYLKADELRKVKSKKQDVRS